MSALVYHCTGRGGRGCPCDYHAWRRPYARRYAAERRARALSARRMSARTCPRKHGQYGVCGAVLESDVVGGHLVVTCWACDRMARGICRDCPRPVAGTIGRARRCAPCKAVAFADSIAKYVASNRPELRARARKRLKIAAVRQRNIEYKRAWRKANPDKVQAQKQRERARKPARIIEYQVGYRKNHRRKLANRREARRKGIAPPRLCITRGCSIVLTGRKKKCTRCRERDRAAALAALAPTRGRGSRTDLRRSA